MKSRSALSATPLMSTAESSPSSSISTKASTISVRSISALSVLNDKKRKSKFPLERLENNEYYHSLEPRDRGFARLLVTTTERFRGQIDKVLELCQNKASKVSFASQKTK